MHLKFRNVNDAFKFLVKTIDSDKSSVTQKKPSRVGEVIQIKESVTVTYTHPTERVLFNRARDANPFFHLYESLWMLAGHNDTAPLNYYSSKYTSIVSDDGITQNAAYGHRWRTYFKKRVGCDSEIHTIDQLKEITDELKRDPDSRRVVLQMWSVNDLNRHGDNATKDVACNCSAFFSISNGCLDMTVCNRSNDMIWGMLGANVVHFSFLQEYLAACIGVGVGVYNQFTNNLHVYTERWVPDFWLSDDTPDIYEESYKKVPLVKHPDRFDQEVVEFVDRHSSNAFAGDYQEEFLCEVAQPMMIAFHRYKNRDLNSALRIVDSVVADDWRIAGHNWLKKRVSMS